MHASVDIPDGEKTQMTRAILEIFRVMIPGIHGCRKSLSFLSLSSKQADVCFGDTYSKMRWGVVAHD